MEPDEYYDNIDLHIRWSDRQDLILTVSPDSTIYSIKQKVKEETALFISLHFCLRETNPR